jgi:hypothetical protein
MSRQFTDRTTLANLKKEAKRWLNALLAGAADARARFDRALANAPRVPTLRDVQHALALEHGFPGWAALKNRVGDVDPMRRYEKVAEAVVIAYDTGDGRAMRVVWEYFGHRRTWDATRRYLRLDLGKTEQPRHRGDDHITIEEARSLVARAQGFATWEALATFTRAMPRTGQALAAKPVDVFASDEGDSDTRPVSLRSRDWDEVIALVQERRLPGLNATGQMTDALLERVSRIEHITALDLSGSKGVSDAGLRLLARLPRLRELNLSGCGVTDRGLDILRRLPALERVALAWTPITDAGAEHLVACDALRAVDLSGTQCGDGALRALVGKPSLADVRSGNCVTDAGLTQLQEFPVFKTWQGGDATMALLSAAAKPNYLMLRGPFTNDGMARLGGLEGLFAINLDSDRLAITGAGLQPLARLPHLSWLAFDATDESMPHIAALPHLRFLLCQDTSASDDGFVALSRSRTIEYIWGRRCYNLRRRGFLALSTMVSLRHLSVSCRNVDDEGLSALPRFPALHELMPMDVPDEGYRYIGRCPHLESLVLMYCRDTTDAATEHITALSTLKQYFVSYNRITDRTPALLSEMPSLEEITFSACAGLTNAGIRQLARLPRLRKLDLGGMPGVTSDVADDFPPLVRVSYNV